MITAHERESLRVAQAEGSSPEMRALFAEHGEELWVTVLSHYKQLRQRKHEPATALFWALTDLGLWLRQWDVDEADEEDSAIAETGVCETVAGPDTTRHSLTLPTAQYRASLRNARAEWSSAALASVFKKWNRKAEVFSAYKRMRIAGHHPEAALFGALYDWDLP